ncbi:Tim44 domain-containing protein [Lampropedia puyangensis]|uniref:Tim44 domain-containing protein n=1 Tax=Lampropedia puyangensis TaxID=1330072 RepID=A0A4S8ERU8_9BURK|nr:Tim44-like domain-containing protein [Lampropedia puyangensis]THT97477.1 Tim44 domain-containing protein [Lampropedia puyangensis]
MKKIGSFFAALFLVSLMFVHIDAEARRMGGGSSVGRQSNNVTQRQATTPTTPRTPAANAPARPRSPMMGILGGLAAGLGLAWLASSLGLGEEFGSILMMILLGLVVMTVIGFIMRSRNRGATQGAFAGGAAGQANPFSAVGGNATNRSTSAYNPSNVGNDASARPFEQAGGSMIGSALAGSQAWGVPDGFDTEGFLTAAKRNFVNLQKAWDDSDLSSLRAMMTDEMLVEIRQQLAERDAANSGRPNHTAVITLDAKLLGIEELNDVYMASVEFSGMISEDAMAGPAPFREVWNMTKPKNGGSGWLVAGLQALQ